MLKSRNGKSIFKGCIVIISKRKYKVIGIVNQKSVNVTPVDRSVVAVATDNILDVL